jgi:hypothetical protein
MNKYYNMNNSMVQIMLAVNDWNDLSIEFKTLLLTKGFIKIPQIVPTTIPTQNNLLDLSTNNLLAEPQLPSYTPEEKCPEYDDSELTEEFINKHNTDPKNSYEWCAKYTQFKWIIPVEYILKEGIKKFNICYNNYTRLYEIGNQKAMAEYFGCRTSEMPRSLSCKSGRYPNEGTSKFICIIGNDGKIVSFRDIR